MLRDKPEPISIPLPERSRSCLDSAGAGWSQPGASMCIDVTHSAAASDAQQVDALDASLASSGAAAEIRHEDLQVLSVVGHGSSGMVQKVLHKPTNSILALKVIPLVAEESVRRAILLELRTLHGSQCPAIVSFYGAFYREGAVQIALEYMDASLMDVLKGTGSPIPERVLLAMTLPLLQGLAYLHKTRRVIHRDIKPSNLLIDKDGSCKIADFGVSGELQSSLSKCASWVGTVHYMSPERISGGSYSFNSDLWSLGLSLLELAGGRFPYPPTHSDQRLGFWDLVRRAQPPPRGHARRAGSLAHRRSAPRARARAPAARGRVAARAHRGGAGADNPGASVAAVCGLPAPMPAEGARAQAIDHRAARARVGALSGGAAARRAAALESGCAREGARARRAPSADADAVPGRRARCLRALPVPLARRSSPRAQLPPRGVEGDVEHSTDAMDASMQAGAGAMMQ